MSSPDRKRRVPPGRRSCDEGGSPGSRVPGAGTLRIKTFGCKVNQYDSQLLLESFTRAGWRLAADGRQADVCVINACTVTAEADRRARQALRRERRQGVKLLVLVGCLPPHVEELGADLVVRAKDKHRLPTLIMRRLGRADVSSLGGIGAFTGRQRALMLVQTGCDHKCAYCVVPLQRGRERSRTVRQVVAEARRLAASGHRELVLSGIRLGAYGKGRKISGGLAGLVKDILVACPELRLRLSSIEPGDISRELIRLVGIEHRLCPHLHLPVQSGSSGVLKAMRRDYGRREYFQLLRELRAARAGLEVSSDVMVGFPGESEKDFQLTISLVKKCGFLKVHAFRYSPRPGTAAADFPGQVPHSVKKERMRRLLEVTGKVRRERLRAMVGRELDVLIEKRLVPGRYRGRADNYAEVEVQGSKLEVGGLYQVRVTGLVEDMLVAERSC